MNEILKQKLKDIPSRPGCYLMRNRSGAIIYVGKAVNLRRRVLGYFRPNADLPPKVRSMVHCVEDLDFMTVRNDAEALLTEASLIKKHKPRFNILMRDDKRYLALRADPSADFPRFAECRIVRDDGAVYFGPFPSSTTVRTAKDFVEKRFGLRCCKDLTPDEQTHCHCMADVVRFCTAPCIGKISPEEYGKRFDEACEFLRGHRPAVLAELKERMLERSKKKDFETAAKLRDVFTALTSLIRQKAVVRRTPEMSKEAAKRGLEDLARAIGLNKPPHIIECADISNLFGTHNVASLVVAVDGLPAPCHYRHFKIESFEGADDPRAMAEVVRRRYGPESTLQGKSPRADLFICDGGITQLRAARRAFAEIGVNDIPTIALAERLEELVFDDGRENLLLPRDSEALFVCTRLRDEAHRFAITYHRKLRERAIRESVLDEVPGIGPAKKIKLLKRFHSIRAIANATAEEIASAAGISISTAEAVLKAVKRN